MKVARLSVLALLVAVLGGCSADGGPVGTGVSASSISGNVVSVSSTPAAATGDQTGTIASVRVTIDEVPGVQDTTGADGTFELDGDFSGSLTLRFSTSGFEATEALDVPAGSAIVLEDIQLAPETVQPRIVRQLRFYGKVVLTDCQSGILLVNDRRSLPNQFLVRLRPETNVVGADGQPLQCDAIPLGSSILAEGTIQPADRTLNALNVVIGPPAAGQPQPVQGIRFVGDVALVNCNSAMLLLTDVSGTSRLRLSNQTVIQDQAQQPLECADINVGDHVEGQGAIQIRKPGVIDVITMSVTPPASP
jgi:hypothetical protein